MNTSNKILVTGASGYIGSRLVLKLLNCGYKVKAAMRSHEKFKSRKWSSHENVEFAYFDGFNSDSIIDSLKDVDIVFYLIHSMNDETKDFATTDRILAQNMVDSINKVNTPNIRVKQLIYLGGLGDSSDNLSKHLRSRHEVAKILQQSSANFTQLRAAMIIGSGSASFEILRYLVDRLPLMITPKWVYTPCEPIAIRNVLEYLVGCIDNEKVMNKTFDIGCGQIVNYYDLMNAYAKAAGLPLPKVIPVPFFTPYLSSYWIHYITPLNSSITRPLAQGLKNPVVCKNFEIREIIPQELLFPEQAIKLAINKIQHNDIESHWSDAGQFRPCEWWSPDDPNWSGGTVYYDIRQAVVNISPQELWKPLIKIGGKNGYYYGNWLWALRGLLDKIFGGVGLRRGRKDSLNVEIGDALDFWRVGDVKKFERLLLIAEMKLPGEAVLEFNIFQNDKNQTVIKQIARFHPQGLLGILYWFSIAPLHEYVFTGMLKGIIKAAQADIISFKKIK